MNHDLLDRLPETALLPVSFVKHLIADLHVQDEEPLADLTCEQVGQALGRRPSTIRGWLHAGELAGYKLGRQWRITRGGLRTFQDRQREKSIHDEKLDSFRAGGEVNLSAWRKVRSVT